MEGPAPAPGTPGGEVGPSSSTTPGMGGVELPYFDAYKQQFARAQSMGARCDRCYLRRYGPPVFSEEHPGARCEVVGEAPGRLEVQQGRPFVGAAGMEEQVALVHLGIGRTEANWRNALLCQAPESDLDKLDGRVKQHNESRGRRGLEPLPRPLENCRPRLLRELACAAPGGASRILLLGATALKAVVPWIRRGIMDTRGGPLGAGWDARGFLLPDDNPTSSGSNPTSSGSSSCSVRLFPTLHPAMLLEGRHPKWRRVLHADHAKAARWFWGKLDWQDPRMVLQPPVEQLAAFLGVVPTATSGLGGPRASGMAQGWRAGPCPPRCWDYETEPQGDILDAAVDGVNCLGVGTAEVGLCVAFRSRRLGPQGEVVRFHPPTVEAAYEDVFREWLTGPGLKVGQNSGYFDTLVAQQHLGVTPDPQLDLILVHHLLEPEMPHGLAFIGSVHTDVWDWKGGAEGAKGTDDNALWIYNLRDDAVPARVIGPFMTEIERRGLGGLAPTPRAPSTPVGGGLGGRPSEVVLRPSGLLGQDHQIQQVCVTMKRNGVLIDQAVRATHEVRERALRDRHAATCRELADDPGHNPNSADQVRKLLYGPRGDGGFGLEPVEVTDSGLWSVADNVLRQHLMEADLDPRVHQYLLSVRRVRAADKVLGTYLVPLGEVVRGGTRAWEARQAQEAADRALVALRGLPPPGVIPEDFVPGGSQGKKGLLAALAAWGVTPPGARGGSVSRDTLLTLWRSKDLPEVARRFLAACFDYWLQTNEVKRLQEPPDEDEENRCHLRSNGRIHADWKAHVVETGRLASSPNEQNRPVRLRNMIVPSPRKYLLDQLGWAWRCSRPEAVRWAPWAPGGPRHGELEDHVFVYADMDQVELRIAAARWQATKYLEGFATSRLVGGKRIWLDVHQVTMHAVWGDAVWDFDGAPPSGERFYKMFTAGGHFDRMRDVGKRVRYASLYRAAAPTVHEVVTSAEVDVLDALGEPTGDVELPYLGIPLDEIRAMLDALDEGAPEFLVGAKAELKTALRDGFLREPVGGRRIEFTDGVDLQKAANSAIQPTAASIMNDATIRFDQHSPLEFAGPYTGLVNQSHDSLLVEVPRSRGAEVAGVLVECLSGRCPSLPGVEFRASAKILDPYKARS